MDQLSEGTNTKQDIFDLCYYQNNPMSLTITKKPKIIYNYLYEQGTYIWILEDQSQHKHTQQQIQKMTQLKINFIQTIQDVIQKYRDHQQKIILICNKSRFKQVQSVLQSMFLNNKIFGLIFYGNQKITRDLIYCKDVNISINIRFVYTVQQVIKFMENDKKDYSTANFINFIFLDKQRWNSNRLVKIMFSMIRSSTNVQQILRVFKQLALLCFPQFQPDIQKFVQEYQMKGNLIDGAAIKYYSSQSFVFRFVNRILRVCKDPTCLFIIQPFFKDLFSDIYKIYAKQKKKYKNFICYRGGQISQEQIKKYQLNINGLIQNLGFLSTSTDQNIAKKFAVNAIFQIQVDDAPRKEQIDYGFADIVPFSQQTNENQILFNPLNSFKIVDFGFDPNKKERYLIKLKYGELARLTIIQKQRLTSQEQDLHLFGQYQVNLSNSIQIIQNLIQQGYNLQGSQQYAVKFIEIAKKSQDLKMISFGHSIMGLLNKNRGDFQSAERQCIQGLRIYEKLLSQNENENKIELYENIAVALSNLGVISLELGKNQKAVKFLNRCLNIQKQIFGQYNPFYSRNLIQMARAFDKLNQQKTRIQCLQKSQMIRKQLFGEDHPTCAIIFVQLGETFIKQGQYQQAVECLLRSQKIIKNLFGEWNQHYATIMSNLGVVFGRLARHEKAIEYLLKAQQIEIKLGKKDNAQFAITLNNLGCYFMRLSQYQKAIEYLIKGQKIQRKWLGEWHQDYALTINNLGISYNQLKQYKKGEEYLIRCLNIRGKLLGKDHPNYIKTLNNLGMFFIKSGQYQKAVEYLQRCQNIQKEIHNEGELFAMTLSSLGTAFVNLGQYKIGIGYLLKSQKIQKQILVEDHPDYIYTLINLGIAYDFLGLHQDALRYLLKCENIQILSIGIDHPDYVTTLDKIGGCYMSQGQYIKAIKYLLKCEIIQRKSLEQRKNYSEYATILGNLGVCFNSLNQNQKAVQYLTQGQKIRKKQLGEDNLNDPEFFTNLSNLGLTFGYLGQKQKSLQLLLKCQKMYSTIFGQRSQQYIQILNNLGMAFIKLGQPSKALGCLLKCQKIIRKILPKTHKRYLQIMNNLAHLFDEMGQVHQSLIWASKCGNYSFIQKIKLKIIMKNILQLEIKQVITKLSFGIENEIKQNLANKNYNKVIQHIKYYLKIAKKLKKCHGNILIYKMDSLYQIYIQQVTKQVSKMYQLAHYLQYEGKYKQAQHVFIVHILQKHDQLWKQMPQIMSIIQSDLQNLQQQINQEKLMCNFQPPSWELPNWKRRQDIIIKVQNQNQNQQHSKPYEETRLYYYLNTCKKIISQITKILDNKLFQFSLYDQVLSYVESVDIEAARTAMQIIIQQQKQFQQSQDTIECQKLVKVLNDVNSLFMIMLDIYNPRQDSFSERFIKSKQLLEDNLNKEKDIKQQRPAQN